jgi:hypothetical protein
VWEDLAHNDDIAQLIRSVGPTIVINALLYGPQLTSRWTARYASVLTDDPGSAVLTLTSFGMVDRSRPSGREASRVIAPCKDPTQGVREITLEAGAQRVLLTVCMNRATRHSADLRWPIVNGTSCYNVAVRQIQASNIRSEKAPSSPTSSSTPTLGIDELTILTAGRREHRMPRHARPNGSSSWCERRERGRHGAQSLASLRHRSDSPTRSNLSPA